MAHVKSGGSTALGRDSQSQRLGVKKFAGEYVLAGMILVRQRGTKIRAGRNVKKGKDDTLYAQSAGLVKFTSKRTKRFDGSLKQTKFVHILPK